MDVDRSQFHELLPTLIKYISTSHFIAIDLELSGIPTKTKHRGRISLPEYYQELRLAASEFYVLQVGLTFVEEDVNQRKYLCRSFNFNLNPVVPSLKYSPSMERKFSYSSSAVEFLLSHGYQMDAPFVRGIPYLSVSEEQVTKQHALQKWDRETIPDMVVKDDDAAAHAFLKRIRSEISRWKRGGLREGEFYNVTGPNTAPLSRFQKRLVHQIIRSEYPDLDTVNREHCVSVTWRNERDTDTMKKATLKRISEALFTQIGFRWIADAMAGRDISQLDPKLCGNKIEDEPHLRTSEQFSKRLEELKEQLPSKQRVIVGHNCFIDLVYFYQTFFGDLPESLEDFQASISQLFPVVIDTKYLATSIYGGRNRHDSQLWQLDDDLAMSKDVIVETPPGYGQYSGPKFHEAGWDSFVTAKVLLRLSKQLNLHDPHELKNAMVSATEAEARGRPGKKEKKTQETSTGDRELIKSRNETRGRFSHANPFEQLESLGGESSFKALNCISPNGNQTLAPNNAYPHSNADVKGSFGSQDGSTEGEEAGLIPQWDSDFWDQYANRLRVYSAEEEILDLTKDASRSREARTKLNENAKSDGIPVTDEEGNSPLWTAIHRILRLS